MSPPSQDSSDTGDLSFMRHALALAREALTFGEVPVGAVVVKGGRVISQAFNLRETLRDPTAHAERLALTLAGQALGTWRLDGCSLYVTLEPCAMCAGALVLARVGTLVFGAYDAKAGAVASLFDLVRDPRLNHRVEVRGGIREIECSTLLSGFFAAR